MSRLQEELHRLYSIGAAGEPLRLVDPQGRVRAMVLELARPANWQSLSRVWQGVQADLGLPAPAIAVSGIDGLQLWFALQFPVPVARARAFLNSLHRRYMPEIEDKRVRLLPGSDAGHARLVPALQAGTGNWSAFIASDLAPVFADTPWLDMPPGEDGQALLLAALRPMAPEDFDAALGDDTATPAAQAPAVQAVESNDPRRFLLQVMNDPGVALGHRIEAAKALLPHAHLPEGA